MCCWRNSKPITSRNRRRRHRRRLRLRRRRLPRTRRDHDTDCCAAEPFETIQMQNCNNEANKFSNLKSQNSKRLNLFLMEIQFCSGFFCESDELASVIINERWRRREEQEKIVKQRGKAY
jgi:hypothetical protein